MTRQAKSGEAVVIGGGVVGLASALALARRGFAVIVAEQDRERRAASWGNAGHIAIEQVQPLASWSMIRSAPARLFARGGALALPPREAKRWGPFAARMAAAARHSRFEHGAAALTMLMREAMPAWKRLAPTLPAPDLLREDGHFVLWQTREGAAHGRAAWMNARIGAAEVRDVTADEMVRLLSLGQTPPAGAIRFTNTGQIVDLSRLAEALETALEQAGGRIVRDRARLVREGERAAVELSDGARLAPDIVLLAAGVRSGALIEPMGHRAPIIAERGYHIRSADHDWPADLPPVVFEDRSMIVTRYADTVQAASFVELASPDAPPDPAKWERLEHHVAELGLPMRGPFSRWMGARPTFPDYLPAIGRSRRAGNLLYAFGHQHLGLTLAPVTAEIVSALAAGERPGMDIAPFDLDRFARRGA